MFEMYNSIIHNLYIVLCVHHSKSSLLPSSFIPLYPLIIAYFVCVYELGLRKKKQNNFYMKDFYMKRTLDMTALYRIFDQQFI